MFRLDDNRDIIAHENVTIGGGLGLTLLPFSSFFFSFSTLLYVTRPSKFVFYSIFMNINRVWH